MNLSELEKNAFHALSLFESDPQKGYREQAKHIRDIFSSGELLLRLALNVLGIEFDHLDFGSWQTIKFDVGEGIELYFDFQDGKLKHMYTEMYA